MALTTSIKLLRFFTLIKINIVNTDAWAYEALQRSQLHVVELVINLKSF
jgi:hypothetical protein